LLAAEVLAVGGRVCAYAVLVTGRGDVNNVEASEARGLRVSGREALEGRRRWFEGFGRIACGPGKDTRRNRLCKMITSRL
jgi:hypothetical protein